MKPTSPVLPSSPHLPEVVYAKNQPQYRQLPAVNVRYGDDSRSVVTCYTLEPEEIAEIARTGRIWLEQMTFGRPLQPQRPTVYEPLTLADAANAQAAEKFVVLCEHVHARIELPCVQILNDAEEPGDSGLTFICPKCLEDAEKGSISDYVASFRWAPLSRCDAMTVQRTIDRRKATPTAAQPE